MRTHDAIKAVADHLAQGGEVDYFVDDDGRRYVKLVRWAVFGKTIELSGSAAATVERMISSRSDQDYGVPRR